MPYRTTWTNVSFAVDFFGTVTAEEIEAVNVEFCGDPRFDTVRSSIWDMSRITQLIMEINEVEYAAAIDKGASHVKPSLKGAIVVPDGDVRIMVERYLAVSSELETSWDTRLFSDIDSARAWIQD